MRTLHVREIKLLRVTELRISPGSFRLQSSITELGDTNKWYL